MKSHNLFSFIYLIIIVIISSCDNQSSIKNVDNEQDTVSIDNVDTTFKKSINVSKILIDTNLIKAQLLLVNKQIDQSNNIKNKDYRALFLNHLYDQISSIDAFVDTSKASLTKSSCIIPSSIRDLKDGVSLLSYDFHTGDEKKLGLMGFLNVDILKDSKITVLEFAQFGSSQCEGKNLPYGIGARLMLQVTKKKKSAKLETPQQITASVIFEKAEVKYSMRTFGISGPKVSQLIRAGILSENTSNDFINSIADIVSNAYSPTSDYVITPQYMPLLPLLPQ